MKNEDILKLAIEKAVEGGYEGMSKFVFNTMNWEWFMREPRQRYFPIIFSHSFAKAFWGEEYKAFEVGGNCYECGGESYMFAWQYHLQTMVLEPKPLKYLEKFL